MSIVEKMASDALSIQPSRVAFSRADVVLLIARAITATGLTEAQLEGLANGTIVVAPVEPDDRVEKAAENAAWDDAREAMFNAHKRCAMLAAKEG